MMCPATSGLKSVFACWLLTACASAPPPPPPPAAAPPPKQDDHVSLGEYEVIPHEGSAMPAHVPETMYDGFDEIDACYHKALARQAGLSGTIKLAFDIDTSGVARHLQDDGGDIKDKELVHCVIDVVATLKFEGPGTGFASVSIPVIFKP